MRKFELTLMSILFFKRIQKQRKKAGMKYYLVEQDQTFDGMEPLEAIQISHDSLKKFGFK
ncbi:MAG: hypothetical protein JJU34_06270 [Lunatimonas sp.]|uniref:hypothetical protein n=1 Tax=Lunatimonas sp. TaxID=2060141 RepID=UPI00263AC6AC|nr:hypothetical protein [Lunatimonas sp.]MCC5936868.1 hypothetical protein [Lunatimonas sp.]